MNNLTYVRVKNFHTRNKYDCCTQRLKTGKKGKDRAEVENKNNTVY